MSHTYLRLTRLRAASRFYSSWRTRHWTNSCFIAFDIRYSCFDGSVACDASAVAADFVPVWGRVEVNTASANHSYLDLTTSRLLPSATSLLSTLSNPLNITLLASQLLSAPAIWDHVRNLAECRQIFSVFYAATLQVAKGNGHDRTQLSQEDWITAVVKGADEQSPRWRHLLLIGGLLLGIDKQDVPSPLRTRLESALVKATNLALHEIRVHQPAEGYCVVFVLNCTFALLADHQRAQLDYDILLPLLVDSAFFSVEGLEHGYWLGLIGADVIEVAPHQLRWPAKSRTFGQVQQIQSRSMVSSLGPLSRLIAHSIENVANADLVTATIDRLAEFARSLTLSWRQNKLSGIDFREEAEHFDAETMKTTLPTLWQILRVSLFATVIILRAALGRLLYDPFLSTNTSAPLIAMQCLHTLRNLYFISVRLGQTSNTQYAFVNFTAIDVLSRYPESVENFMRSIRPVEFGQIPQNPLERCHDLFFFNTAEHFTLALTPQVNDELLIAAALPYLSSGGNNQLLEIFEAAHSLILAVLAVPHNADLATKHLPFYIETLLESFPANLSSRQFRLAFKTVIRITTPPSPLSDTQPLLQSILLEIVHDRAMRASPSLLPETRTDGQGPPLSEQAVLVMTLIDSLCFLSLSVLEEWLPLTAELVTQIKDSTMRQRCQERFWESLSGGEMDVERAAVCVAWWTSRGGREMVLYGEDQPAEDEFLMSGALLPESKL